VSSADSSIRRSLRIIGYIPFKQASKNNSTIKRLAMRFCSAAGVEPKCKTYVVQGVPQRFASAKRTGTQNCYSKGEKGARKSEMHSMSFEKFQKPTLTDRLSEFARNARDEAKTLEPGPERQALLEKARKAEAASEIEAWANSSGAQKPKPRPVFPRA
jgi:hypothetical protein